MGASDTKNLRLCEHHLREAGGRRGTRMLVLEASSVGFKQQWLVRSPAGRPAHMEVSVPTGALKHVPRGSAAESF